MNRYLQKLKIFSLKRQKNKKIDWVKAPDIYKELVTLVNALDFAHVKLSNIKVFRSFGSKSYARARIWAFPKIWQQALNLPPHYIIEVLSEKFDHLSPDDKKRVLIHELMHIPKNFSGSLVSHKGRYHRINSRTVDQIFNKYKNQQNNG